VSVDGPFFEDLVDRINRARSASGISHAVAPGGFSLGKGSSQLTLTLPSSSEQRLVQEIAGLKQQLGHQQKELLEEKRRSGETEKKLTQMKDTLAELERKETLSFVSNRIHPDARRLLLETPRFSERFLESRTCLAYVMSVDIRRSTELMLKARTPELYATFISTLCRKLMDLVLDYHGVFDKFTGDGILAFFPDFYSGDDAGYYAVSSAQACHAAFASHYDDNRNCFVSVLRDIGLGIGIDFGETHLVRLGDGLTVVGTPVVYACRMAGSSPGLTLLNQPAYEVVSSRYGAYCSLSERDLEVKHEGRTLAYEVSLGGKAYSPNPPSWHEFRGTEDSPRPAGGPAQETRKRGAD
jgi:class 3 adenylate cyclase